MSKPFAKLFGADENQILVELGRHPDTCVPSIRIAFPFPDEEAGLGIIEFGLSYEDSDAGWDKAELAFEKMTEELARLLAEETIASLRKQITEKK